jgi:hypothetical protein
MGLNGNRRYGEAILGIVRIATALIAASLHSPPRTSPSLYG